MRTVGIVALIALTAAGCTTPALSPDMGVQPDSGVPQDSGGSTAEPDLASPPRDLASLPDLVPPPPDLYTPPDLYFDPAQCGASPDFAPLPSCTDGVRNQDETDIDCGGLKCPKCADGAACAVAAGCKSGICQNGKCLGCADGAKDQDETDIDCGGKVCAACRLGKACLVAADCLGGLCTNGKCAAPATCSDGKYDGKETDVDCGGPCAACPTNKHCLTRADCVMDPCSKNVCTSCSDGIKDGDETDTDCGGSCPGCGQAMICHGDADCDIGACVNRICRYKHHCFDKKLDADETDVDCGGADCVVCGTCQLCKADSGCISNRCIGMRCAPPLCTEDGFNPLLPGVRCVGTPARAACDEFSCTGCCHPAGAVVPACDPNGIPDPVALEPNGCCIAFNPGTWCGPHGELEDIDCNLFHCDTCCAGVTLLDCVPKNAMSTAACGGNVGAVCGPCPLGTQCTNGVCQPLP